MTQVVQTQVDLYENEYNELPKSLDELQDKGYLSDKQVQQANRNGIKINDGHAVGS
jgi:competence protein ComGC